MDVHKASISLCALDDETGEIIGETKCANDPKLVVKFVKTLKKKGGCRNYVSVRI